MRRRTRISPWRVDRTSGYRVGIPALFALAILLGACAATPPDADSAAHAYLPTADIALSTDLDHEASAPQRRPGNGLRRISGAWQIATLYARTRFLDPVLRPFSNATAYYSVILRSATGLARRTAISTVQFPRLEQQTIPPVSFGTGMDLEAWEGRLDRIVGSETHTGKISFLVDGEEYFPALLDAVGGAQSSIDIRTYIFDNDDYAVSVADLLKERSRDVKIKVLLDGIGSLLGTQTDSEHMPADFRPLASVPAYLRRDSKIRVRTSTNPWLTGDHTKTTIVDGERAFVGGMNIGREYRYEWHDMMMDVTGPVVSALQHESDRNWAKAGVLGDMGFFFRSLAKRENTGSDDGYPIRVLQTRGYDSAIYRAQLAAIRSAEKYIFIENAYFSDDVVLYELAKARRRGVDVRVVLSGNGNHQTMSSSINVAINAMLRNGIRVYLYPGMSHLKAAVYDGWVCVGSANFDKLSLEINKELNLATSHPEVAEELIVRVFARDFASSVELHEEVPVKWTSVAAEVLADELM